MRDLLYAVKRSDVVESIDTWGETTVEAEDLIIDEGGERKVIEEIGEVFPNIRVAILPKTFIVESIDLCNLTRFVVATEDGNALGVSDFESNQESDCLYGIITSINIVTHEEVVGVWIWPPDSEKLHQIMKLSVNISAYCHRAFHWLYV